MAEETIYNSIHTGEQIDSAVAWLLKHAQDHICGGAAPGTTIETPSDPTYWFAGAGAYVCGSSTISIPDGRIGIISYDGSDWSSETFDVGKSIIYLDSMGEELDGSTVYVGPGMVIYDPDQSTIKKCTAPDVYETIGCNENVLYCNKVTNIFYRWNTRSLNMIQIGAAKIKVINNLTDGGDGDALSAEMGKELADRIDNAIESIGHITITKDGDTFKMKVRASASEPVISIETMMEGFGEVEQNTSKVKQILVKGWNINGPVTLISNNGAFLLKTESGSSFLDTVTLNPMNNGTLRSLISVQFSPSALGINTAIITASYQNISSFVSLNGTCVAEAEPSVEITTLSDNIYSSQAGEQSVAYVRIQGYNLSSPLTLAAVIGNSSSVVSLNKNTLTAHEAENGEVITVFYTPASGVTFETIVLSVTGTGISETEEIAVGIVAAPAVDDTITVDGMLFNVLTAATKSTRGTVEICHTSGKNPGTSARSNYRGDFEIPSEISYYMYNYDVTGIRERAFYYSYITSLKIPASITNIGAFVVQNTSTIVSFEFVEGCVAALGFRMFNQCAGIGAANLPNSIPSIGEYAFSYATNLAKVRIGSSRSCALTTIGQYAFYNCNNITEVVCWATNPPTINGTATNFMPDAVRTTAVLKVPSESVSAYQTANIWKTFSSIVAIDE